MRIALVSREYPPFFGGGIGTFVHAGARALAAAGHEVRVVTEQPGGRRDAVDPDDGVTVHRLALPDDGGTWGRRILAFATRAGRLATEWHDGGGLDVAEFADTEAPAVTAVWARAFGATRVPIVLGLHTCSELIASLDSLEPDVDATMLALFLAERVAAGVADAHISPSAYNARWYARFYGLAREPAVVRYPLNGPPADPPPLGDRCVLYVGRLEPRKGVATLLEAWPAVARRHAGWTLRLVGGDTRTAGHGGSLRGELAARLPEDVRATVEFTGARPPQEVATEIAAATLVVVPSRWDNFPNTGMEAMAAARPVVVGDVGGTREMVDGSAGGVVVPSGDAAALGAALTRLLAEPTAALTARGAAARTRIASLCDPLRVAAERVEVYRHAIARATTRSAEREARHADAGRLQAWHLLREAGRRGHGALTPVATPVAEPGVEVTS